jgi:hypothetical protein
LSASLGEGRDRENKEEEAHEDHGIASLPCLHVNGGLRSRGAYFAEALAAAALSPT